MSFYHICASCFLNLCIFLYFFCFISVWLVGHTVHAAIHSSYPYRLGRFALFRFGYLFLPSPCSTSLRSGVVGFSGCECLCGVVGLDGVDAGSVSGGDSGAGDGTLGATGDVAGDVAGRVAVEVGRIAALGGLP